MGREASITQEQVNAAADAIRAAGGKPTARAVRETLGGGSMATVLKFLQVWQGGQVRAEEPPVGLPPGLQRALVDFVGQEVAGAKAALQDELLAAQQAAKDLIAESERQAGTIETQAEALDAAQVERAELVGRLAQMEADLARSADEAADARQAAEAARTDLAKALLRLEALPRIEAETERLRQDLDAERLAKVAAEQAAAVALAKLEGATDKAETATKALDKAERQAAQAMQELSSARVQVQAQQTALDAAARECDELRRQAKEAKADAKTAGETAAELRGRLAQLAKESPARTKTKTSRTSKGNARASVQT